MNFTAIISGTVICHWKYTGTWLRSRYHCWLKVKWKYCV